MHASLPLTYLRMYYTALKSIGLGATQPGVRSALSVDDGITWTRDPGWRLSPGDIAPAGVMDPAVVRLPDGRFKLYVTYQGFEYPPPGTNYRIYSSSSTDGLNFIPDSGVRIQGGLSVVDAYGVADPFPVLLPGGIVRLYFNSACPSALTQGVSCANTLLSAVSASAVNANAVISGPLSNQTITVAVNARVPANCSSSQIWIAAIPPTGELFFFTPNGWAADSGYPAWGSANGPVQIPIVQSINLSALQGTGIYAGYGCDVSDMLNSQRYVRVHVVQ